MRLLIDTHTHTIYSGHASGTFEENAANAAKAGLKAFVTTDHGPSVVRYNKLEWLDEYCGLPKFINGLRVYKGAEANIINYNGDIDLPEKWLGCLEFTIASFHGGCIRPGTSSDYTEALMMALKNPILDVIAHPGNPEFPVDIEKVVMTAGEFGKMIEINNSSIRTRQGSQENCMAFLRACRKHGVKVVTGSDCHVSEDIGKFDIVLKMLDEAGMPPELVITSSAALFEAYINERKRRLIAEQPAN